jgi:lambda family phage minor tail protein L
MKNLSQALLMEAMNINSANPWLILFDIILPDSQGTLRLVKNNENITFDGDEYLAFPLELDSVSDSSDSDIQTLTVKVSNVTRVIQAYLEELDGLIGGQVTLRIVNAGLLSENYSELERTYDIIGSSADSQYVSITLGAPNPLGKRFPLDRYLANHCNWKFKTIECGYVGIDLTCKRTLEDCQNKVNSRRFGGHPGLTPGGISVV